MSQGFYQAKYAAAESATTRGLFRDGKYLVVELADHEFPDQCVKTDLPISGAHAPMELKTQNVRAEELNLVRGLVVSSTGQPLQISENNKGNRVVILLGAPLAPEMLAKLKSRVGTYVMIASAVFTVAMLIGAILTAQANSEWFAVPLLGMIAGGVGILAGYVISSMRSSSLLTVQRLADGKVWLKGAHHDWLARLPVYQISPGLLQREYRRAVSSTWWSFGTAIGCGIAAIIGIPVSIHGYNKGVASRDWPSVQGQVVRAYITSHKPRRSSRYWRVNYEFVYVVAQEQFSGKSYLRENSPEQAEATLQAMPPGSPAATYYNPADPADYRMVPGLKEDEIFWIIGAAVVSIVAVVAACYGAVSRSRASVFKDQIDGISGPSAFGPP